MAEELKAILTCSCHVCGLEFRAEAEEAEKHVFRTESGRLLVLCPLHLEQARFDKLARETLGAGALGA